MEKDNYTFNNIDKKVLDENLGEASLKACNDEKLMKRLIVSSLGEIIPLLDDIDKSVNVINALIGTVYAKDLEEYFKVVAKNVRKAEKEEKQKQNNVENVDNIN